MKLSIPREGLWWAGRLAFIPSGGIAYHAYCVVRIEENGYQKIVECTWENRPPPLTYAEMAKFDDLLTDAVNKSLARAMLPTEVKS